MIYLCTVADEVIRADSDEEALDRMREMLRQNAVAVNVVELKGETE